jgi:ABC-type multidrug transport system ATPase subunit
MTTFFRHLNVLLHKNYLLQRRAWMTTLFEIFLPIFFTGLMVAIWAPPTFQDENSAAQEYSKFATVQVWPMQAFAARLAMSGEKLAIVPFTAAQTDAADALHQALSENYPGLNLTNLFETPSIKELGYLPPLSSVITRKFATESDLISHILQNGYGQDSKIDKIYAAIVVYSGSPKFDYAIRLNISGDGVVMDTSYTSPYYDQLRISANLFGYGSLRQYWQSIPPFNDVAFANKPDTIQYAPLPGFMSLQLAVDRAIINRSAPFSLASDSSLTSAFSRAMGALMTNPSPFYMELGKLSELAYSNPPTSASIAAASRLSTISNELKKFMRAESYAPQQISLVPFPTSAYRQNSFYGLVQGVLSLFVTLSFLFPVSRLIKAIVSEKEYKQKEGMLQMGLSGAALNLSWVITYFFIFALIALGCTILTHATFFARTDFGVVFFTFLGFGWSTTAWCFLISTFFTSAKTATSAGVATFFALGFPLTAATRAGATEGTKFFASFAGNTAFGLTLEILASFESQSQGVNWTNVYTVVKSYSVSLGLIMMFADVLIYILIGFYFEEVLPRAWGVPRPFYFPFLPSFWREVISDIKDAWAHGGKDASLSAFDDKVPPFTESKGGHLIEPLDSVLTTKLASQHALSARGITKSFSTPDGKKVAVDNLDVDIFEGQILCLLGHNGAGKTTTMQILTGTLGPDQGEMNVFGYNLRTKAGMRHLRNQLGVCPQHDVLWSELTVIEHLEIFSDIKGVDRTIRATEIEKAIQGVGLTEKKNALSASLSGGMKRKLSVAIALLGGSKVVVLDEPTSGMDPYSRRSTWQMLQNAREGRIMLLTTHFMDEADVLADRIAIMAHGKVRCAGTPLFLKQAYGVGYLLVAAMEKYVATSEIEAKKKQDEIEAILKSHIHNVGDVAIVGSELSARLPFDAPNLSSLFAELEQKSERLGISSFNVSVTTSEAIFLKVAKEADAEKSASGGAGELLSVVASSTTSVLPEETVVVKENLISDVAINTDSSSLSSRSWEKILRRARRDDEGTRIFLEHLRALIIKRFNAARRDFRSICCAVLVPVVVVLFGFLLLTATLVLGQGNLEMSTANYNTGNMGINDKSVHPFVLPAFTFKKGFSKVPQTRSPIALLPGEVNVSRDIVNLLNCLPPGNVSNTTGGEPDGSSVWLGPSEASVKLLGDPYGFIDLNPQNSSNTQDAQAMGSTLLNIRSRAPGSTFGALVWESPFGSSLYPNFESSATVGFRPPEDSSQQSTSTVVEYTAMINSTAYHGAPLVVNLINSALLAWSRLSKNALNSTLSPDGATCSWSSRLDDATKAAWRLTTRNFPLPPTLAEQGQLASIISGSGATFAMIGLAFVPAAVAAGVVKEREMGAKHQQRISGVSVAAYWISHYLFDFGLYLVTAFLSIGVYKLYNIEVYVNESDSRINALFALYLLFGAAVIPFAYLLSFAFRIHSSAQNTVLVINMVTGAILIIVDFILSNVPTAGGKACKAEIQLQYVWRFFPAFSLGHGLYRLSYLNVLPAINANCPRALGEEITADMLKPIGAFHPTCAGTNVIYLACTSVLYLGAVIGLDTALGMPNIRLRAEALFALDFKTAFAPSATSTIGELAVPTDDNNEDTDPDVVQEAQRVKNESISGEVISDVIQLRGLRKVYPAGSGGGRAGKTAKVAVRNLSFGVPVGEVFGFLGINGAGKSTSMGVLTGETLPTRGTAVLAGLDIVTQQPKIRRLVGYCPQFDALIDNLTLREHLELFARIKGIPEGVILKDTVSRSMAELGITEFANKLAARLSGGTKRKLCLAIALIGNPPLLILDEPTTGVDAVSRRHIWGTLQRIASKDKTCSIMLTTHSMEEAEALCTRIGIMVGGRLRCLGSSQHLKSTHGSGFQLDIKLKHPPKEAVSAILESINRAQHKAGSASKDTGDLKEDELENICKFLERPERALSLKDEVGEGAAAAVAHSAAVNIRAILKVSHTVPVSMFAEWFAQENMAEAAEHFVEKEAFGSHGVTLIERHGTSMRFVVSATGSSGSKRLLSDMFARLEKGKDDVGIEGFSLGQTSLEQVFVNMAGQQTEEVAPMPGAIVVRK